MLHTFFLQKVDKYLPDAFGANGPVRLTESFQNGCDLWKKQTNLDVTLCNVNDRVQDGCRYYEPESETSSDKNYFLTVRKIIRSILTMN